MSERGRQREDWIARCQRRKTDAAWTMERGKQTMKEKDWDRRWEGQMEKESLSEDRAANSCCYPLLAAAKEKMWELWIERVKRQRKKSHFIYTPSWGHKHPVVEKHSFFFYLSTTSGWSRKVKVNNYQAVKCTQDKCFFWRPFQSVWRLTKVRWSTSEMLLLLLSIIILLCIWRTD